MKRFKVKNKAFLICLMVFLGVMLVYLAFSTNLIIGIAYAAEISAENYDAYTDSDTLLGGTDIIKI